MEKSASSLSDYIHVLNQSVEAGKIEMNPRGSVTLEGFTFPSELERTEAKLNWKSSKLQSGEYGDYKDHYFQLASYSVGLSPERIYQLFKDLYGDYISFSSRHKADTILWFGWQPEDFIREKSLPKYLDRFYVSINTVSPDIDSPSINNSGLNIPMIPTPKDKRQVHELLTKLESNSLVIRARGDYLYRMEEPFEVFKPDVAVVHLTREDQEKLLTKGVDWRKNMREVDQFRLFELYGTNLAGQKRGVADVDQERIVEVRMTTNLVRDLEGILEKSLVTDRDPGNVQSGIVEWIKNYSIFRRSQLQLEDLKRATELFPQIDLGFRYDQPLISVQDAKRLLNKDFKEIARTFTGEFEAPGWNIHVTRGPLVRNLARVLLESEIEVTYNESTAEEFVAFLSGLGYQRVLDLPYSGWMNEKDNLPDRLQKELHLFVMLQQTYQRQPAELLKRYQQKYIIHRPKTSISASSKFESRRLKSFQFPQFGIVDSINLHDFPGTERLEVGTFRFFSNTNLKNSKYLPLQERVFQELGITFPSEV